VSSLSTNGRRVSVRPRLRAISAATGAFFSGSPGGLRRLSRARRLHWPSTRAVGIALAVGTVSVLVALEVSATVNLYALRVIGDTPTFMALIRDMAQHPFQPQSPFFGTADTHSIHASPYLQALALVWKSVAPAGHLGDAIAIGRFLGIVTIPVSLGTLGAFWWLARTYVGRVAAWFAIPALLAVLGPAHVIFASDLSLHGFLYDGYYPTTFATGLTFATLALLPRRSRTATIAAVLLAALTLVTDPFNGLLLSALMVAYASRVALSSRRDGVRVSLMLLAAFALAGLWPAFSLFGAFDASGLPVPVVLAVACAAPWVWAGLMQRLRPAIAGLAVPRLGPVVARCEKASAVLTVYALAMLGLWWAYTARHPTSQLLTANRLGFYWDEQRDRWLLLVLSFGACGVIGLVRLARSGRGELLAWLVGCYAVGALGALTATVGINVPLYTRFILVCQAPLAIGLAAFIGRHRSRSAAAIVVVGLVAVLAIKATTLIAASGQLTYWGSELPTPWRFGNIIPAHSGVVAADPGTSYYLAATTNDHVFTLSLGHADSGQEGERARAGYSLLHAVYSGTGAQATVALRRMWARGVRWVIVERYTSLAPPTLDDYYAGPYSSLVTRRDGRLASHYIARIASVAHVVKQTWEFTIFRLDGRALAMQSGAPASIASRDRPGVGRLLARLEARGPSAAQAVRRGLLARGVHTVTVNVGWMRVAPRLSAYADSLSEGAGVHMHLGVNRDGACVACGRVRDALGRLGTIRFADSRFVVVRLA
jgi:hypothetical protein